MQEKTQTFSQQLRERLVTVEKRDWELWILALGMLCLLAIAFFFTFVPAVFFGQTSLYVRANLSPQLLFGFMTLVVIFIILLFQKHLQLRTLRFQSFVEAWNFQVSHVQLLMDPLTQVFSRAALEEILAKEIKRVKRKQGSLVFLYIDINDFKKVNTEFGHLSGDLVLAEVGGLLKQCARGSDYVVRMGGDEFLVALVDTNLAGAGIVKGRVNEQVEEWNRHSPLPRYQLRLSVGIQEFDPSKSFDEVLAQADSNMYAEKEAPAVGARIRGV